MTKKLKIGIPEKEGDLPPIDIEVNEEPKVVDFLVGLLQKKWSAPISNKDKIPPS